METQHEADEWALALQAYRHGTLTREDLLRLFEQHLAAEDVDGHRLLAMLNQEQARERLPGNVHNELVRVFLRRRGVVLESPALRHSNGLEAESGSFGPSAEHDLQATLAPKRREGPGVGTVLEGRYRLVEPLGEGAISVVYHAIDLRKLDARADDAHVAVKLIPIPMIDVAPALEALRDEVRKLHALAHPNIARVIHCGQTGRTLFLVSELLTGTSLKREISRADFSGLPPAEALALIEVLATTLTAAHARGIVHGDLKPSNVFLTDSGAVKILDFGLERLMTRDPGTTVAGDERPKLAALSPPYASPEMFEGAAPDPRDDVYALACLAYELLTGRHPFDRRLGIDARASALDPARRPPLQSSQWRAIKRALAFERGQRTRSPAEFLQELQQRRWLRADRAAVAGGLLLIVGLITGYYEDHGRIAHWIRSHGSANLAPQAGESFRDCPTCPLMVALPAGQFNQGATTASAAARALEQPRHPVRIGYALGMGVYEVTVREYKEFVDAMKLTAAGCELYDGQWRNAPDASWDAVGFPETQAHPVVCVSFRDAVEYAGWLSKKTGHSYRLPSESEWEYAARAGSPLEQPWAQRPEEACLNANVADRAASERFPGWKVHPCSDGYVYTAPVGSFRPNGFGLYDSLGNVMEWVQDCWHESYSGAPSDGSPWLTGGDCTQRGVRGGSWFTAPSAVGVDVRNRFAEDQRSASVGFRVVRELNP
ncbi:MAG: SUMF1/EgtB/PvdO family nonheme iron enzyme [Sinobacteraceae bacterium]|nr:SUMF1/EgtB/PvdO family nonheme iron enzyme [Nevskiaceae bacterium]